MKTRKSLTALMIASAFAATLAGCSSKANESDTGNAGNASSSAPASSAAASEGSKATKLDPVTLKIVMPGDRPADMDVIIKEAEKRMADNINVKLDLVFVPWSDLAQKTQVMLASGENVDLIFDAPWLHMEQMISAGYYEPMDDLLQQYGQDAIKVRSQQMFDANKFQGKIYGLPLGNTHLAGRTYLVRKDLREKYGLQPIKTYDELIQYAYKVKENEKDVIPLLAYGQGASTDQAWGAFREYMEYPQYIRSDALGQSLVLYYKNNDGKVYNLFDEMEPTIWSWIQDARKLYTDGLIHPDVLALKDIDSVINSGKVGAAVYNEFGVPSSLNTALAKNVPGAELEAVTFVKMEKGANITNFKQANFQAIPKVSKNKERAMMFLNWTAQKENYDLLAYGIEGKNYEAVGDDQYKQIGTDYSYFPYAWVWNPTTDRLNAGFDEETIKHYQFNKDAANLTPSILTGFSFDPTPVMNEISLYNATEAKYYNSLFDGVTDPDSTWASLKKEGAANAKKIQVELQKQIDAFLAQKK
ncbi:extracellular solute-binding protein [Cohnella hashimotonis]|uniref:Extracellular solute-binding protein n=1 Tax=Cohnella hashimotonis TaxID=2826895 RepID=A0ABT6TNC3_9BACL|nr:extracellular solute-binding protein [Cohnella hashimotonis]MDI4648352.1 extracellular solute-binding protein [Cohnella hashimotonis]